MNGTRMLKGLGRFLLTDAHPRTANPLHQLTGKRLKPALGALGAGAILGVGGVSAAVEVEKVRVAGLDMGVSPIERFGADGAQTAFAGGVDPTLGARGDIVFGLRNLARRG